MGAVIAEDELACAFDAIPDGDDACAMNEASGVVAAAFALVLGKRRLGRFATLCQRMEFVRGRKAVHAERRRHQGDRATLSKLAKAWNSKVGLRYGDRVALADGDGALARKASANLKRRHSFKVRSKRGRPSAGAHAEERLAKRPHANTWDVGHMLKQGFANVGCGRRVATEFKAGEVGEAHGGSNMIALASEAAVVHRSIEHRVGDLMSQICSGCFQGVFISRSFDATPYHVQFGALAQSVQPVAWYLHFDDKEQRWRALHPADWDQVKNQRPLPARGVVEVQARAHNQSALGRYRLAGVCVLNSPVCAVSLSG